MRTIKCNCHKWLYNGARVAFEKWADCASSKSLPGNTSLAKANKLFYTFIELLAFLFFPHPRSRLVKNARNLYEDCLKNKCLWSGENTVEKRVCQCTAFWHWGGKASKNTIFIFLSNAEDKNVNGQCTRHSHSSLLLIVVARKTRSVANRFSTLKPEKNHSLKPRQRNYSSCFSCVQKATFISLMMAKKDLQWVKLPEKMCFVSAFGFSLVC